MGRGRTAKKTPGLRGITKKVIALDLPIYDSMAQCEGATGVPIAALTLAKKHGSKFIHHGRVHFGEFIRWWFGRVETEDDGDDKVDWGKRDKRASALMRELKLEQGRAQVVEFATVENFLRYLIGVGFFGELDRLTYELPATLKGKSEVEINEEMMKQVEIIKKSLASRINVWVEKKGKE